MKLPPRPQFTILIMAFSISLTGLFFAGCVRSIPVSPTRTFSADAPSLFPDMATQPAINEATTSGERNTDTPLIEETASPEVEPSHWSLERAGYENEELIILVLLSDNEISHLYQGDLSGTPFECTTQELKPNNLYCYGPRPESQDPWLFQLIRDDTGENVFQVEISKNIME